MRKDVFMESMNKALEYDKGIEVWVKHPDLEDFEIIMNSKNNVQEKKKYYDKAYDEDMKLKSFPDISIVKVMLLD